ncbi:hypothetical protein TIMEGRIFFIN_20 [Bacillus phage vB_BspH_TimeGriffin]|nr:hypothetical protein TIMEGRIFFIN_20 [Bacillus phage vB_BspH_TimeGriffin]
MRTTDVTAQDEYNLSAAVPGKAKVNEVRFLGLRAVFIKLDFDLTI